MATTNKYTNYYKVPQPVAITTAMSDSQNIGDQASFTNYTFYQRLIQGSASRVIRYREYDLADHDVEIARSLDTIAEEMTGNVTTSPCPLEIQYITPYGSEPLLPRNSTTVAVEAALHYWSELMQLDRRMFGICRTAAKYGDCFFVKNKKGKWEYVHPKNVAAAIVDEHDMTNVVGWQIRRDIKEPTSPFNPGGQPVTSSTNVTNTADSNIYSSDDVVWFSLGDDVSESAPFGESVLRAVYKAQKQKELLEDSVIIYRLVRAPERRVFYVDVGKMPPHKVKGHLEQIRNEYRQRNTPSHGGGTDQVDAVYNPMSTSEDMFFATRPGGGGTKVETLPAGQNTGVIDDLKYFQWKVYRGLRIPLSYMSEEDGAATVNDGANAYVAELRFAQYIMRLQKTLNRTFDIEFKRYLRQNGIKFDPYKFRVKLPDPENFGLYRQQAMDSALLTTASSASGINGLSTRFIMQRYLGLDEAEIKRNERLKMEEMGIDPDSPEADDLTLIYNAVDPNGNPMVAGSMDMGGFDMGGMGGFDQDTTAAPPPSDDQSTGNPLPNQPQDAATA